MRRVGWRDRLEESFSVGIGICSGPAHVGNTGSKKKFKYGPLGTTVNLASRLQEESRGGDIVLSRTMAEVPAVAALLEGIAPSEEQAALKGFDEPVAFLRLVDVQSEG